MLIILTGDHLSLAAPTSYRTKNRITIIGTGTPKRITAEQYHHHLQQQ